VKPDKPKPILTEVTARQMYLEINGREVIWDKDGKIVKPEIERKKNGK